MQHFEPRRSPRELLWPFFVKTVAQRAELARGLTDLHLHRRKHSVNAGNLRIALFDLERLQRLAKQCCEILRKGVVARCREREAGRIGSRAQGFNIAESLDAGKQLFVFALAWLGSTNLFELTAQALSLAQPLALVAEQGFTTLLAFGTPLEHLRVLLSHAKERRTAEAIKHVTLSRGRLQPQLVRLAVQGKEVRGNSGKRGCGRG